MNVKNSDGWAHVSEAKTTQTNLKRAGRIRTGMYRKGDLRYLSSLSVIQAHDERVEFSIGVFEHIQEIRGLPFLRSVTPGKSCKQGSCCQESAGQLLSQFVLERLRQFGANLLFCNHKKRFARRMRSAWVCSVP